MYPEPESVIEIIDIEMFTPSPSIEEPSISDLCELFKDLPLPICDRDGDDDPPQLPIANQTEIVFVTRKERLIPERKSLFLCHPYSDEPMTPCKDLLGSWVLRILTWLLFIFVMFGNGVMLVLIIKSACRVGDWRMPHIFLFQLTIADIGVGIYLGFLVVVDLKTFSQHNFYQLALFWQHGPGCLAAGFIAIFSLELSIYTLVIIAMEGVCVLTYGLQHIKMYNVIIMALIGWLFAAICASLPLIGYNSYSSVAICLPLDVVSTSGRYYIAILMGTNLLTFLLLSGCYLYIYCRIRQTNTNRKMFHMAVMVIFVDYLCWTPLVIVCLAALSNEDLINTNTAKWFAVLVLPINACAYPFIYILLTEKLRQQVSRMYHRATLRQLQQGNSNALEELGSSNSVELAHALDQVSSDSLSNRPSKETVFNKKVLSGSVLSVTNPMFKRDCYSPSSLTREEDSTSITSFSIDAVSNNKKVNAQVAVEENDI